MNLDSKIYKYFFIFIIGFLVFSYIRKQYHNYCDAKNNRFVLDRSEFLPYVDYVPDNDINTGMPEKTYYLFWTGGFDSTFRLCQLLLDQNKRVQPIYLKCSDLDSSINIIGSKGQRNNVDIEMATMKRIRQDLISKDHTIKHKLLPTHYVTGVKRDSNFTKKYQSLYHELHYFTRSISQYERLARYAYYHIQPIEIGLEKCGTGLDQATHKYRIGVGEGCQIMKNSDLPTSHKNLHIFGKLRFPISHLDKKEMKNIALQNNYYDILQLTWSCWQPTFDGNPCGKCPQCLARII